MKIIIPVLIICFICNLKAVENKYFEFEGKYELSSEICINPYSYDFHIINSEIYYNSKNTDENCTITFKCLSDRSKNDIHLQITDSLFVYKCSKYNIDIVISNETLYLQFADKLLIFNLNKDIFTLEKMFLLNGLYGKTLLHYTTKTKAFNNNFIGLYGNFRRSTSDEKLFYFFSIDINAPDTRYFHYLKEPEGFYWTLFQPRVVIDACETRVLSSDITNYCIKLYDYDGNIRDSIERPVKSWKSKTFPMKIFKNKDPRESINLLQLDTITTSLIHRTEFIDSNTILVCYSIDDKNSDRISLYHEYYDIWVRENNIWEIKYSDIDSDFLKENSKDLSLAPLGRNYKILDGKLISFHFDYKQTNKSFILIRRIAK